LDPSKVEVTLPEVRSQIDDGLWDSLFGILTQWWWTADLTISSVSYIPVGGSLLELDAISQQYLKPVF